jgi:hypothetical protein
MKATTTTIRFELDSKLNENATIEQDDNGLWGFTTNRGYNSWEGKLFKSFDEAYSNLKKYEKNSLNDLKYE